MGLLWAELRRFGVRPAIRWIAGGMLAHVALVVALTAFETDTSTLAELLARGELALYAMILVLLACVAGVLLVTGDAAAGQTRAVLTVEPRRGRVYWSKVAAAALAVLPGVAVAYAVLALGMYGVHARADALGAASSELALALLWCGVRVLALAACAAASGAALGVLVRRWWIAVGLVAVGSVGGVFLEQTTLVLSGPLPGELLLLGVTVALAVLGWAVFRSRDVR